MSVKLEAKPQDERCPFRLSETLALDGLADAMKRAGYTETALAETIAISSSGGSLDVPVLWRRVADDSDYHTLVRLFYLGDVVPKKQVASAIDPEHTKRLVAAGLLHLTEQDICATAKLVPFRDMYVLGDFSPQASLERLPSDHVLGVGAASVKLAGLTVKRASTARQSCTGLGFT